MEQNAKNIDIKLDTVDVLTSGTAAEFVNGILDFLLFQRRQIPFVYRTYKYYVEKWSDAEEQAADQGSFANYQLNQQRSKAKATKESISDMRELIRQAFRTSAVKSLRFLFGANTFMPSEAYTLHIPHNSISRSHYCEHHALPEGRINQALLRLLTCEDLYTVFSTELNATNVFLELELLTPSDTQQGATNLISKAVLSRLPRSCKNIHLHLLHSSENLLTDLRCCQQMEIFQDLNLLKLDKSDDCSRPKAHAEPSTNESSSWWQSEVVVRGFRTLPNQKSGDLWTS